MHKRMSPHGDFDHMGEAINLVNNIKVENVIFNCENFNNLKNSKIYRTNQNRSIMFKIKK